MHEKGINISQHNISCTKMITDNYDLQCAQNI